MARNSKSKKKAASSKRRGKKPVKVKDLPGKRLEGREVLGGSRGATNTTLNKPTQTFGGAVLDRGETLNLGL
ncbi:MAG: hypothetical protein ACREM3_00295 [Candidatus Rokuibacteriota bacterium]